MILLTADALGTITAEAPRSADGLETGGILLGHDLHVRIVVTVAGDPGHGAQRHADQFLRDLQHARNLSDRAYERDASIWIGEWHTHPGGPSEPSRRDMDTYSDLLGDGELGFVRIVSLIVTPCRAHGWTEVFMNAWIVTTAGAEPANITAEHTGAIDD